MEKTHAINSRLTEWQERADRHKNYQKIDPFPNFGSEETHGSGTEKIHNIDSRVARWQQTAEHRPNPPKTNPRNFQGPHYQNLGSHEQDDNYGRPVQGSKTEFRGKSAGVHVSSEIVELCSIIQEMGTTQPDGSVAVLFGELFEMYTRISNKVVGMLMRARRQGLVAFEGEMLYQRRDDHVAIRLIKTPDELMNEIEQQKNELKHHPAAKK